MNIEQVLEHVRTRSCNLASEYQGRLSELADLARSIEGMIESEKRGISLRNLLSATDGGPTEEPAPDSSQLTTGGIVKPTPPRQGAKPAKDKTDSNGAAEKKAGGRGGARAIREFVDSATEEFNPHSLTSLVGCTHSAVSCALLKLQREGVIERVRHGWYRRVMPQATKKVATDYAKFREELGELKAPSIALGTCSRGDE